MITSSTPLKTYHEFTERFLLKEVQAMGEKSPIRDACEYAVMNGGKRLRPIIVVMVGEALGNGVDLSHAASAIEFFHTASLVVDDLPCMDNDDLRRNRPTVHRTFGETMALLVSYALIAEGYEQLAKNAALLKASTASHAKDSDHLCYLALQNASFNTGLKGATGGQFLDVYPPDLSLPTIRDVIHKKTTSLYEISFVLGWLFGGGDLNKLDLVKKAASHFGMAFQIADDLGDEEQDMINQRKVNLATLLGRAEAEKMFHVELSGFRSVIHALGIATPLESLTHYLDMNKT